MNRSKGNCSRLPQLLNCSSPPARRARLGAYPNLVTHDPIDLTIYAPIELPNIPAGVYIAATCCENASSSIDLREVLPERVPSSVYIHPIHAIEL